MDGVLRREDQPVIGACDALTELRRNGVHVRLLTNDGWSSRRSLCGELNSLGIRVEVQEIFTAASIAAEEIRRAGSPRTLLMSGGASAEEFTGIPLTGEIADVVLVGDYFRSYDQTTLNTAFLSLIGGARFLAMQRNRYWPGVSSPIMDAGFWVSGLEYCTHRRARVVGKPARQSYLMVCRDCGALPCDAVMISDDAILDLVGAKRAGLLTVQTNEYTVSAGVRPAISPDLVLPSLADYVKLVYK